MPASPSPASASGAPAWGESRGELGAVERELTRLLRRARATSAAIAGEVHPDLDPASYGVLLNLSELVRLQGEGVRAADLAETMSLHKSTMSRTVTQLERLGLIERVVSPDDARARVLTLTPTGRAQLDRAVSARRDRVADTLGRWTSAELSDLGRLLKHLNDDLD